MKHVGCLKKFGILKILRNLHMANIKFNPITNKK